MRLLYGTGNPSKLEHMRDHILRDFSLEIIGLNDVEAAFPDIPETGKSPLENACIKARAYHKASGLPVFSCDSGLHIEGLTGEEQPGVHVRTVGGRYLSDGEMIAHYSAIADRLGGRCRAWYINAICLILEDGREISSQDKNLSSEPFLLTSLPHRVRKEGYPLDSLSIDIASGKYYYDLEEYRIPVPDEGFRAFFRQALQHQD